jgi:hypothetical protein
VYGFYSLVPHRLEPDEDTRMSGYTGGALSGYLIAKVGIHQDAAKENYQRRRQNEDDAKIVLPPTALLLIDALVDAEMAARHAGGKYCFIDLTNEPKHICLIAGAIGFKPIKPEGSATHFIILND